MKKDYNSKYNDFQFDDFIDVVKNLWYSTLKVTIKNADSDITCFVSYTDEETELIEFVYPYYVQRDLEKLINYSYFKLPKQSLYTLYTYDNIMETPIENIQIEGIGYYSTEIVAS